MKLSDKVFDLIDNLNINYRRLSDFEIVIDPNCKSGEEIYFYYDLIGECNLYGLLESCDWTLDVYSLEVATDEEILFINLSEGTDWKTHSELLDMLEGLIK
jgi:hypothetical protein